MFFGVVVDVAFRNENFVFLVTMKSVNAHGGWKFAKSIRWVRLFGPEVGFQIPGFTVIFPLQPYKVKIKFWKNWYVKDKFKMDYLHRLTPARNV